MLLTNNHLIIAAPDTEHLERNIKNILLKTACGVYSHTLSLYFLLPSSLLQSSEVTRGGKDENRHGKATDSSRGPQGLVSLVETLQAEIIIMMIIMIILIIIHCICRALFKNS